MIAGVLCGALWFVVFVLGQLFVLRLSDVGRPQATNRILVCCLLGSACNVAFIVWLFPSSLWTHGGALMGFLWSFLTLVCLFVLYMPFYYTIASSLSVRTMVLLGSAIDGSMTAADVSGRFISPALIEHRLEIMRANGFLVWADHRKFVVTRKGRRLAITFGRLKRLWRMDAGG
jgi:hypothetical protein